MCSRCVQSDGVALAYVWLCRDAALHLASDQGHTQTALALVEAGADVHCKDKDGYGLWLARDHHACVLGSLAGLCDRCIPSDGD